MEYYHLPSIYPHSPEIPSVSDIYTFNAHDSCLQTALKIGAWAVTFVTCGLFYLIAWAAYATYAAIYPQEEASVPLLQRVQAPIQPQEAPPSLEHRAISPIQLIDSPSPEPQPLSPPLPRIPTPSISPVALLRGQFEAFQKGRLSREEFIESFTPVQSAFVVDLLDEESLEMAILIETIKETLEKQDLDWIFSADEEVIASHAKALMSRCGPQSEVLGYYYPLKESDTCLFFAPTNDPREPLRCLLFSLTNTTQPLEEKLIQMIKGETRHNPSRSAVASSLGNSIKNTVFIKVVPNYKNPENCLRALLTPLKEPPPKDSGSYKPWRRFPYALIQTMSQLLRHRELADLFYQKSLQGIALFSIEEVQEIQQVAKDLIQLFFLHKEDLASDPHCIDLNYFFDYFAPALSECALTEEVAKAILDFAAYRSNGHELLPTLIDNCLKTLSHSQNAKLYQKLALREIQEWGYPSLVLLSRIEKSPWDAFAWNKIIFQLLERLSKGEYSLEKLKTFQYLLSIFKKDNALWKGLGPIRRGFPETPIIQIVIDFVTTTYNGKTNDYFFRNHLPSLPFYESLAIAFFQTGQSLTSPTQIIRLYGALPPESPLRHYLDTRKDLFPQEVSCTRSGIASLSDNELTSLLTSQTMQLEFELRKGRSSPERVDLAIIAKAQRLKKEVKERIKALAFSNDLHASYQRFCNAYDAIVDHVPLLALLRKLSREFRAAIQQTDPTKRMFSEALLKFFVLWNDERDYQISHQDIEVTLQQLPLQHRHTFLRQKEKVMRLATNFFSSNFWQTHNPTHMKVHGTKLATLRLITKFPRPMRALKACGELVQSGIAPFAGELCGSMRTLNAKGLSFERPTNTLEDPTWKETHGSDHSQFIFSAPTHYMQSVLYAIKRLNSHGTFANFVFDEKKAWEMLSETKIRSLLNNCSIRELDYLAITILRLRMIASEEILTKMDALRRLLDSLKNQFGDLLDLLFQALDSPIPFQISPEEVPLMQDLTGIVFGCFSAFDPNTAAWNGEISLPSGLQVGPNEDIPVVFALPEAIDNVRGVAEDTVEVRSLDELLLAEMLTMLQGSRIQRDVDLTTLKQDQVQSAIASSIRSSTLPLYAKPLPKTPKAPVSGGEHRIGELKTLENPFFGPSYQGGEATYRDAVETTEAPARETHGVLHMLRITLFAQIFQQILAEKTGSIVTPKERYLTAMAAAFHDSAREDEGQDRWDELSAWNFREFLLKHSRITGFKEYSKPIYESSISSDELTLYYNAIAHKDSNKNTHDSLVRQAVHDGDCIEILRCLPGCDLSRFRQEELVLSQHLDPEELQALIVEMQAFIQQTENISTKIHLEYESASPYEELVSRLTKDSFPLLHHYFFQGDKLPPADD